MDSFQSVKDWVKELQLHGPEDIVVAIVGNKLDLEDRREVPIEVAQEFADSIGAILFETSAKTNVAIDKLFVSVATSVANSCQAQSTADSAYSELPSSTDVESVNV